MKFKAPYLTNFLLAVIALELYLLLVHRNENERALI